MTNYTCQHGLCIEEAPARPPAILGGAEGIPKDWRQVTVVEPTGLTRNFVVCPLHRMTTTIQRKAGLTETVLVP